MIVRTDGHPQRARLALAATHERKPYIVAEIVVEVEQRARMTRIEDCGQRGLDWEWINKDPAKLLKEIVPGESRSRGRE